MFLIDTSVWIDYLRGVDSAHVVFLDKQLSNPIATGISDLIYLELLQGARDQRSFATLEQFFSGQRFYRFADPLKSHALAAKLYFDARKIGISVRSSLDCLIAQCAMEHDLILLHNDKDFLRLAKVTKHLKQKHFLN
jgi:predicted nucleic acid-binding protein